MKAKIARIADLSYLQLTVIFLVLVLLEALDVISLPIYYPYFILILPLFALPCLLQKQEANDAKPRGVFLLLLAVFIFALVIRLLPLANSSVPLGYDPGFYKYTIDLYANSLPNLPEAELATWIREMYPQGLPVLTTVGHAITGADATDVIRYLFPFLGALLVFPVFMVTRNILGVRAGLIAAVLYAVSYTQYEVFTYFYLKNVLGLLFLLLAVYALEKRRYALMALFFAGLGIFHRPEFLLFALVLLFVFVVRRRPGILLAALGTAVLVLPFWLTRWEINWGVLTGVVETAVTNVSTGEALGGGTFFDLGEYASVAIAYLPFALMGGIYLAAKRMWNSVLFWLIISAVIVIARLFFFNRFIIPLDIAIIITAVVGIEFTLLRRDRIWRVAGIVVSVLVLAAALVPTVRSVAEAEPLLTEEQLQAVEWLRENAEENAYVIATTNDAPWVLGWSERRVLSPGLFEWDASTKEEWDAFMATADPETAAAFLETYNGPIYIYYSINPDNYMILEKFDSDDFEMVYNDGAVIYRFEGGEQP